MQINDTDWFQGSDGYYYYLYRVNSGGVTNELIESRKQTSEPPVKGYALHVAVIAQTIQALGSTDENDIPAVTDAWEIEVDTNKNLVNPGNSGT